MNKEVNLNFYNFIIEFYKFYVTAMGKWSEAKAAYRFFDNEKAEVKAIYESQRKESVERTKVEKIILAVQETTVFNYTLQRSKKGFYATFDNRTDGLFPWLGNWLRQTVQHFQKNKTLFAFCKKVGLNVIANILTKLIL